MSNPYKELPEYCYWNKAMTMQAPGHVDCVTKDETILPTDKVATMGSCFAQHISKNLQLLGFNYFVTEQAPTNITIEEAKLKNYGAFSARYGNVYTVQQAVQLFDRAYEIENFKDDIWKLNENFIDAYRPQIEIGGYKSIEQLKDSRRIHLKCVKELFEKTDWLVFTLGLTECWRDKKTNAVFPLAPGVAGGEFSSERYESINYSVSEVCDHLSIFIEKLKSVNPKKKKY